MNGVHVNVMLSLTGANTLCIKYAAAKVPDDEASLLTDFSDNPSFSNNADISNPL